MEEKDRAFMKVFLTHGYFLNDDPKEQQIMRPYPPLGLLYISAWLQKHGVATHVHDSTFSSYGKLIEDIISQRPEVVGIYANLMTRANVVRLIHAIKEHPETAGTRIVIGGPEARNHADRFLKHGADFVVFGEGEQTMLDLVQHLERGHEPNTIPGLALRGANGECIINPDRPLIKNLDELPMPDRGMIDMNAYYSVWKKHHGESAVSVNTMRGCPYTCRWCSRAVYGLSYRRRSPAHVADELEHIQREIPADTIWFVDDVFTISHKWLEGFVNELEMRQLKIRYECITRADRMNHQVIELLKRSGCFRVWIGAESGSQRIIDRMDRRVDVARVREMIRAAEQAGIQAGTFIMVGYPGETETDLKETVKHLKLANPSHFTITVTYPIKGTELYDEVSTQIVHEPEWESSSDRDIVFKRTYDEAYYLQALRWIVNEVNAHKAAKEGDWISFGSKKLRAAWARLQMQVLK
ncbi:MAG: radical SAM protein [Salibacteraceae bacterium]